jgi:seryl-tRNA synthetase
MVLMAATKGKETLADEFLEQNTKTVIANIKNNDLGGATVDELMALETAGRKRKNVLEALSLKKLALAKPVEEEDDMDTKALEKRLADLEEKVEGLEARLASHVKP